MQFDVDSHEMKTGEEWGIKVTSRFPATGSEPTGPPEYSGLKLLCLGRKEPNNKNTKKKKVASATTQITQAIRDR